MVNERNEADEGVSSLGSDLLKKRSYGSHFVWNSHEFDV